ncbi:hypothetical protein ACLOJK_014088 [Asimina triloba]
MGEMDFSVFFSVPPPDLINDLQIAIRRSVTITQFYAVASFSTSKSFPRSASSTFGLSRSFLPSAVLNPLRFMPD